MLTDTRIIHRHGGYEVLAHCQAINWPNGDTIGLHTVRFNGHDDMFLRATRHDDLHWIVFDLRDVTPRSFEQDVKSQPRRDTDGMVLFTLRQGYSCADQFLAKALAIFKAAWFADDQPALNFVFSSGAADLLGDNSDRRFWPVEGATHAAA